MQNLFAYISELGEKLSEAEDELRDKRDVIKLIRKDVKEAENRADNLQMEQVSQFCSTPICVN
jgi:chromosome segregation ATPase